VAADQAKQVASTAGDGAKEVVGEARQQARQVAGVARDQAMGAMRSAQDELRGHASQQTDRAAEGLRGLAGQIQALVEGRTDEAGMAGDYARQAGDKVNQLAGRLEYGGFDGVLGEVRTFARRRPGLFLIGAAAAGFAVGRMIRASTGGDDGEPVGAGMYGRGGTELGNGGYPTATDYPVPTAYPATTPEYPVPTPDYPATATTGALGADDVLLAEPDLGTRAPGGGYGTGAR
jgi:hypothetical protein